MHYILTFMLVKLVFSSVKKSIQISSYIYHSVFLALFHCILIDNVFSNNAIDHKVFDFANNLKKQWEK